MLSLLSTLAGEDFLKAKLDSGDTLDHCLALNIMGVNISGLRVGQTVLFPSSSPPHPLLSGVLLGFVPFNHLEEELPVIGDQFHTDPTH